MSRTMKEWQAEAHQTAKASGWHDTPQDLTKLFVNLFCEVAEAAEEHKAGRDTHYYKFASLKPEGVQVELGDVVLRILDAFEAQGWDLETIIQEKNAYNKTRSYRHGGKAY